MYNSKILAATVAILALLPHPAAAQSEPDSKLTLHGFLTQGFAASSDEQIYGIPKHVTADYRTAAVQLRYAATPSGEVVIQLHHHRLGASPMMQYEESIDLNWAFYRHRFGPVAVRVGRFPLPKGIYNEVRDVGTVLPLFRAPNTLYPDGTEYIDGINLSHTLRMGAWTLDTDLYGGGGEFKMLMFTPTDTLFLRMDLERQYGAQLWLSTPLQGLRVGFANLSWPETGNETTRLWQTSVDADFDRFMVRAERYHLDHFAIGIWAYYAHARFKATEKLHAIAQYETSDAQLRLPFLMPRITDKEDTAIGMSYVFQPNLLLKLELHRAEGYAFERFVDYFGPPANTRYAIASIAVSF
jgi:hypothetical protein